MIKYQVIDRQTQYVIATYATLRRANNKCDQLDNAYGAYRYYVKKVEVKV